MHNLHVGLLSRGAEGCVEAIARCSSHAILRDEVRFGVLQRLSILLIDGIFSFRFLRLRIRDRFVDEKLAEKGDDGDDEAGEDESSPAVV